MAVDHLAQRVEETINLRSTNADLVEQRRQLIALVDEVEKLAAQHIP